MAIWNRKKKEPETVPERIQPQTVPAAEELAPAVLAPEQREEKKKHRGKPQNDSRRTRNRQVKLWMADHELEELKTAAAAAGMGLTDYVMAGIHQSRVIKIPGAAKIRTELIREGRNLNYTLMLANAARKEGKPIDLQSILTAVAKVESNLDQLTELLMKWDVDIAEETEKEVVRNADREMQCQ